MTNALVRQFSDSSIARWFRGLSKREQVLIYIVLFLAGIVLSLVLLTSAQNFRNTNVAEYNQSLASLDWVNANKEQAQLQAGLSIAREQGNWRPIYSNAELHNIEIQSIDRGSEGATINIDPHPFQDVLNWIFALQEDGGMRIERVNFYEADPGMVSTSLVLQ